MIEENLPGSETAHPQVMHTVTELAKDANAALNGMSDAVGLTAHVEKSPYAMIGAALGLGYIVAGGLFTPTTSRLIRMGVKLAAIPQVRNRLLDVAESAIDGVLNGGAKK